MAYCDSSVLKWCYVDLHQGNVGTCSGMVRNNLLWGLGLICILLIVGRVPGALKHYYFLSEWLQLQQDVTSVYSLIVSCSKCLLPPFVAVWMLVCLQDVMAELLKAASSCTTLTPVAGHQRWQLRGYRRLHLDTEPIH